MRGKVLPFGILLFIGAFCVSGWAQNDGGASAAADLPDGVSNVKTNDNGSLKSLVVKAVAPLNEEEEGSRAARAAADTARQRCRDNITAWLAASGSFYQGSSEELVYLVSEAGKEAPAGLAKIGQESAKLVSACGQELVTLHRETIGDGQDRQVVLVMGLLADRIPTLAELRRQAEDDGEPRQARRLRPSGPPRSLEDDAPRQPATRRSVASGSESKEPEPMPSKELSLEDFL